MQLHEDPDHNHRGQVWTTADYNFGSVAGGMVIASAGWTHNNICESIINSTGSVPGFRFLHTTLLAAQVALYHDGWRSNAGMGQKLPKGTDHGLPNDEFFDARNTFPEATSQDYVAVQKAAAKNVVALLNAAWTAYWKVTAPGGGIMPQRAPVDVLDGVRATTVMVGEALAIEVEASHLGTWYSTFIIQGPIDPEDDDKHTEVYGGYDPAKAVEHLMKVEEEWRNAKRTRPASNTSSNTRTGRGMTSWDYADGPNPRISLAPCGRIWTPQPDDYFGRDTGVVAWWARKREVGVASHSMLAEFLASEGEDIRDYVHEYLDGTDNVTKAMSDKHVADILRQAHVSPQGLSPSKKAVVDKFRGTPAEPAQPRGLGGYEKQARDQGLDFRRLGDSVDFLGLF